MSQSITITNTSNGKGEIVHVTDTGVEKTHTLAPGESVKIPKFTIETARKLAVDWDTRPNHEAMFNSDGRQVFPRVRTEWETELGELTVGPSDASHSITTWDNLAAEPDRDA